MAPRGVRALVLFACGVAAVGLHSATAQPASRRSPDELRSALQALEPGQSLTDGASTMTMLQKQSGRRDPDGWYAAVARGTGFRVHVPAPFNELLTVGPTTDGGTLESDSLGGMTEDGQRFSATCMRHRDATPLAVNTDELARRLESRGTVVRRWPVVHGALTGTGIEIAVTGKEFRFRGEFFGNAAFACQLTTESGGREHPYAGARATRFFDSFVPPQQ